MNRPSLKSALAAGVVAFICGCTMTVHTSPDGLKIDQGGVSHLPARSVTLVNGHASETQVRVSSPPYTLIVEPKQMTDTAIEVVRRALPRGGKGAAKRVVLRVHSPRQAGPYPMPGVALTVDAAYGDGTRSQVFGEGYSARGADRSFEAALLTGLNRLLADPHFVAYMKR